MNMKNSNQNYNQRLYNLISQKPILSEDVYSKKLKELKTELEASILFDLTKTGINKTLGLDITSVIQYL